MEPVTAFKDCKGNLHLTREKAELADFEHSKVFPVYRKYDYLPTHTSPLPKLKEVVDILGYETTREYLSLLQEASESIEQAEG